MKKFSFYSLFSHSFLTNIAISVLMAVMVASCACTDNRKPESEKKKGADSQEVADAGFIQSRKKMVREAVAIVNGIKDNKIKGKVTFTHVPGGIKIVADVEGLQPGEHGFHVHEHGDCGGADGAAAGSHFNPTHTRHGGPDSTERHVGDLGNIVADEKGHGHYERIDNIISLNGENSIVGRSIIIHADRDDFTTQPTGAAGARIGCGSIEAVKE